MSKELFELLMKEITKQARELNYTDGAAAGDFIATIYCTLECEFFKRIQNGDERGQKDLNDFKNYFGMQVDYLRRYFDPNNPW